MDRRVFAFVAALAVATPGAAVAASHMGGEGKGGPAMHGHGSVANLEQLAVESADTPKEHEALAAYYRRKAEHARQMAEHHRAMARTYHGKMTQRQRMKQHCDKLAELHEQMAAEFEELARGHEAAAAE